MIAYVVGFVVCESLFDLALVLGVVIGVCFESVLIPHVVLVVGLFWPLITDLILYRANHVSFHHQCHH